MAEGAPNTTAPITRSPIESYLALDPTQEPDPEALRAWCAATEDVRKPEDLEHRGWMHVMYGQWCYMQTLHGEARGAETKAYRDRAEAIFESIKHVGPRLLRHQAAINAASVHLNIESGYIPATADGRSTVVHHLNKLRIPLIKIGRQLVRNPPESYQDVDFTHQLTAMLLINTVDGNPALLPAPSCYTNPDHGEAAYNLVALDYTKTGELHPVRVGTVLSANYITIPPESLHVFDDAAPKPPSAFSGLRCFLDTDPTYSSTRKADVATKAMRTLRETLPAKMHALLDERRQLLKETITAHDPVPWYKDLDPRANPVLTNRDQLQRAVIQLQVKQKSKNLIAPPDELYDLACIHNDYGLSTPDTVNHLDVAVKDYAEAAKAAHEKGQHNILYKALIGMRMARLQKAIISGEITEEYVDSYATSLASFTEAMLTPSLDSDGQEGQSGYDLMHAELSEQIGAAEAHKELHHLLYGLVCSMVAAHYYSGEGHLATLSLPRQRKPGHAHSWDVTVWPEIYGKFKQFHKSKIRFGEQSRSNLASTNTYVMPPAELGHPDTDEPFETIITAIDAILHPEQELSSEQSAVLDGLMRRMINATQFAGLR